MRRVSQNSDIAYSDSDSSDEQVRPSAHYQSPYMQELDENNETAASLMHDQVEELYDPQAIEAFQKFYRNQLIKKEPKDKTGRLQKSRAFDRYRNIMKVYSPKLNLYFLPTVILLQQKIERQIQLRNSIVDIYKQTASVQIPKDRPDQILVTIHNQKQLQYYAIRNVGLQDPPKQKHPLPELLDEDLSLNPLFDFYERNYGQNFKFSETCGIFLYWAYCKKLLNRDFLSESALKLIVIFFYLGLGQGIPNIIFLYQKQKKQELEEIKRMYRTNKKMDCELQPELFNSYNFSLKQKRGFYVESQKKYSIMTNIIPVPYPVSPKDLESYSNKVKPTNRQPASRQGRQSNRNANNMVQSSSASSLAFFFKMMIFLQNSIKRTERVIFDFANDRKGIRTVSETQFNIEIKHPVFNNNICDKLTNDQSKLRILKQEISNVVSIYRKSIKNPLDGLCKMFQRT